MADEKPGIVAALDLAMQDAVDVEDVSMQMPLPMQPSTPEPPTLAQQAKRGPGRPEGSKNKKTVAMLAYLQNRYRSPLEALAVAWSKPVEEVASELGCTRHKAAEFQRQCATAALPYWHEKQPMAVQITEDRMVTLVINTGSPDGALPASNGEITIEGELVEDLAKSEGYEDSDGEV